MGIVYRAEDTKLDRTVAYQEERGSTYDLTIVGR